MCTHKCNNRTGRASLNNIYTVQKSNAISIRGREWIVRTSGRTNTLRGVGAFIYIRIHLDYCHHLEASACHQLMLSNHAQLNEQYFIYIYMYVCVSIADSVTHYLCEQRKCHQIK